MKILANDGINNIGKQLLLDKGFEVITQKVQQNLLASEIKNYDVLIVRSSTKVTKEIIDAGINLKLIARGGVGLDNIDIVHAQKKGIPVINTPGASSVSVAELVFAHLFGMVRNLPESNRKMPQGGGKLFNELKKKFSDSTELNGKTLGIIGFGRIGNAVAKIAIGIGMDILVYDKYPNNKEIVFQFPKNLTDAVLKIPVKVDSKEEVLRKSDFITIHTPFEEGDEPIIGKNEFSIMKKGGGIINCSRGGAVGEKALLDALNNGKVKYAGIDVYLNEPDPDIGILSHPNVSLTPHSGASTTECQKRIGIELAEKIVSHFNQLKNQ